MMLRPPEVRVAARPAGSGSASLRRVCVVGVLLFAGGACEETPPQPATAPPDSSVGVAAVAEPIPATAVLVDTAIASAPAGQEGWLYSQSVEADLDADGEAERVVLAARVELYNGRPAWDDGQPWQVYVEETTGERTDLYRRFVQLGTVEMRIGRGDDGEGETVVLIEHLPDRLAIYEVEYSGPGEVRSTERFVRSLDPTGEVSSPTLP